jgi:protein O-GlcNAc transferase
MEPEDGQEHFSERLWRLNVPNVVYPRPRLPQAPKGRAELGLPPQGALYLCPQAPFKLHPDFDAVLADLLARDPTGHVVLLRPKYEEWRRILLARFRPLMGAAAKRVVFLPSMPRDDFLALLSLGDVMLDPFPFGGGNTTLEALCFGTPVVTWPTSHVRGRLSYAFLRRCGLTQGIVSSAREYVDAALRFALDPAERAQTRALLRERCSPLFEDRAPVEALARLLSQELSRF